MASLAEITIYPIKSLDGIRLQQCRIAPGGYLQGDRVYALFDSEGRYINAKRHRQITRIRAAYDLEAQSVSLGISNSKDTTCFELRPDNRELEQWFSDYFQQAVSLQFDKRQGFPDDEERPGPTLISTATLERVQSWFPEISLPELRRRFRSNLEVSDVPAFWEDQLGSEPDRGVAFSVGETEIVGLKPCQRCAVPCMDPDTGEVTAGFQKHLPRQRQASLPEWANRAFFKHYYYLAINTRIPEDSYQKVIHCADQVKVN